MPPSSIAPATDIENNRCSRSDYWLRMAHAQQLATAVQEQGASHELFDAVRQLTAEVGMSGSPLDWWHRFRLLECRATREQVKLTGYRRDAWTQPFSLARQRCGRVLVRLMENDGDDDTASGTGMGTDRPVVASS